jgi:hypothetical protein
MKFEAEKEIFQKKDEETAKQIEQLTIDLMEEKKKNE